MCWLLMFSRPSYTILIEDAYVIDELLLVHKFLGVAVAVEDEVLKEENDVEEDRHYA